jgi:hypothetical protein
VTTSQDEARDASKGEGEVEEVSPLERELQALQAAFGPPQPRDPLPGQGQLDLGLEAPQAPATPHHEGSPAPRPAPDRTGGRGRRHRQ